MTKFDVIWCRYCEIDKNKLDEIDRKARKVMEMNKELHLRSDVDGLHVSRTEGGRELIRCKVYLKAGKNSLGWYVKYYMEPLNT